MSPPTRAIAGDRAVTSLTPLLSITAAMNVNAERQLGVHALVTESRERWCNSVTKAMNSSTKRPDHAPARVSGVPGPNIPPPRVIERRDSGARPNNGSRRFARGVPGGVGSRLLDSDQGADSRTVTTKHAERLRARSVGRRHGASGPVTASTI
jgi:hypothetical protein